MKLTLNPALRLPLLLLVLATGLSACVVGKKKYLAATNQLEQNKKQLKDCQNNVQQAEAKSKLLQTDIDTLKKKNTALQKTIDELNKQLAQSKTDLNNLQGKYDKLISASMDEAEKFNSALKAKSEELDKKNQELTDKTQLLNAKEALLADRELRLKELEDIIGKQDSIVNRLQDVLTKSLSTFSSEELKVEIRNGKVYVSMSDKLLFKSGSIVVEPAGKSAMKLLAEVLNKNPDLDIIIEGHTDNVPMKGSCITDNWDLSVMRATSVVRLLTGEYKVAPQRIQAAGRGEFFPVAPNNTTDGKARNRRTEIIIAPNLDEFFKLLNKTADK